MAMEYSMGVPMPHDEHTGLRDGILRECGLHPPVVALASPDAATRLLACARVASLDDREVYFGPPAAGWAAWAMTPPVKGERERVALSPRNETAACALVLELLTEAGEAAAAVLPVARALCDTALAPPSGDDAGAVGAASPDDAGVGDAMIAWTRAGGPAASTSGAGAETSETSVRVSIVPARFPSTGRGAAAASGGRWPPRLIVPWKMSSTGCAPRRWSSTSVWATNSGEILPIFSVGLPSCRQHPSTPASYGRRDLTQPCDDERRLDDDAEHLPGSGVCA